MIFNGSVEVLQMDLFTSSTLRRPWPDCEIFMSAGPSRTCRTCQRSRVAYCWQLKSEVKKKRVFFFGGVASHSISHYGSMGLVYLPTFNHKFPCYFSSYNCFCLFLLGDFLWIRSHGIHQHELHHPLGIQSPNVRWWAFGVYNHLWKARYLGSMLPFSVSVSWSDP